MKAFKNLFFLLAALPLVFSAPGCNDDDPDPINEEELITTVTLTLTPTGGGAPKLFKFKDLDGPGGVAPLIESDTLAAGVVYNGSLTLLNETETPAENIGEEVEEEAEEHQFFFIISPGLDLTVAYADQDANGKPLGLKTTWTAGAPGSGTLTLILRHEPDKNAPGVADGNIANAGGETDIEIEWPIVIQ
jgi:hypothetical protein